MTTAPGSQTDAPPSYAEVEGLIPELPGADFTAGSAVAEALARFAKREGAPGEIADWLDWLASWQGRQRPRLTQPRISLFACTPGMSGPQGFQHTQARLMTHTEGRSALHKLCAAAPADLRLYDMAISQPTADPSTGASVMDEPGCVQAMAYGMMAVEQGVDLLVIAGLGAGHAAHALALGRALTGCGAGLPAGMPPLIKDWSDKAIANLAEQASAGPLPALSALGTPAIAAMAGCILAARMGRQPVALADAAALVAALVVKRLDKRAADHCRVQMAPGDALCDWLAEQLALPHLPNPAGQMPDGAGAAMMIPVLKQGLVTVLGEADDS